MWCFCVSRDGAVGDRGLPADGLLRGAQSLEGLAGKRLQAAPASPSVRRPSVLPHRQQLGAGQQPVRILPDPHRSTSSSCKHQEQLAAACCPDGPPHHAGVSGLHADAVRHVLQHLDLPWGHRGLHPRLFHLISSPGSDVTVWTVSDTDTKDGGLLITFQFLTCELKGSLALGTKWETT